MAKAKGGLGKGLEALFADNSTDSGAVSSLAVSEIEPNRAAILTRRRLQSWPILSGSMAFCSRLSSVRWKREAISLSRVSGGGVLHVWRDCHRCRW